MRLTRAAQRAQHNDETLDASDLNERAPLNEISPNASPELGHREEEVVKKAPAKKAKSKGAAKKKGKGKKGKTTEAEEEQKVQVVLEDEREAAGSPASDAAVEDLAEGPSNDIIQTPMKDERPASPPSKAVRLTRRQLAMQEDVLKQSQRAQSPPRTDEAVVDGVAEDTSAVAQKDQSVSEAAVDTSASAGAQEDLAVEPEEEDAPEAEKGQQELAQIQQPEIAAPEDGKVVAIEAEAESDAADFVAPSVEITSEPEPKTLSTEKPVDVPMSPIASRTPSRRASRSPSKSPMRIEESIDALDALEEALENVGNVASFNDSADEKSPRKRAFPKSSGTPRAHGKTPMKTASDTPKVSRTPSAAPRSMKATKTSLARASSVRVPPSKDVRKGSTETVDYLATKRRPISMHFPTPPPPPKGRAPTKATFQLSSTIVAEKLKQEKEERLKRQAEGVVRKPRPISMPPPPRSTKPTTKPSFQLPGEKIAAELKAKKEERLRREAEGIPPPVARPASAAPPLKSSKPPTKPSFELPGAAIAEKLKAQREERLKRQEEAEALKKAAAAAAAKTRTILPRAPVTVPVREQPGVSIPPPTQTQAQRSSSLASKRSSIQLSLSRSTSTSSANRNSVLISKAVVTPEDAAQLRLKGKEVFNRDRYETQSRERERKEKEDAAKKARADAAERGRIASREWAEKQRKKMMGGGP
ncbi:hypothetical protein IQ07DRAFT_84483 [Pyrenochaeta sp. DS3sAY3a]|nr:hypothetical protein IQ07DRAFT_84483 [Pyrenochaeta sp. DS3sAY3a]